MVAKKFESCKNLEFDNLGKKRGVGDIFWKQAVILKTKNHLKSSSFNFFHEKLQNLNKIRKFCHTRVGTKSEKLGKTEK